MTPPNKTFFNRSTGKDSALALYHLLQDDKQDNNETMGFWFRDLLDK